MTNATQTTLEARIHENLNWLNRLVGARLGAHLRGVAEPLAAVIEPDGNLVAVAAPRGEANLRARRVRRRVDGPDV